MAGRGVFVFAVEDTSVQLAWGRLSSGRHLLQVGRAAAEVEGTGGAGTAELDGLVPDTEHEVLVDGRPAGRVRTLPSPPGEQLCRIATVSDVHIGERAFGFRGTILDRAPSYADPYAVRCLDAAVDGLRAWGAEHLIVKGDLTQHGKPHEQRRAARSLLAAGVPVTMVPGNHDVEEGSTAPPAVLAAEHDITVLTEPAALDLPGLRVVLADSTIPGHHHGRIDRARSAAIVELAAATPRGSGCLVAFHHQTYPAIVPTVWPPGIFWWQSAPFFDQLAAARPGCFVTSGHTHRNRAARRRGMTLTEVGSTKDWPGSWAGYAVHEGGIRQVVRKVSGRDTDGWLWRTRRAVGGVWGLWSPGSLEDRCLVHRWP